MLLQHIVTLFYLQFRNDKCLSHVSFKLVYRYKRRKHSLYCSAYTSSLFWTILVAFFWGLFILGYWCYSLLISPSPFLWITETMMLLFFNFLLPCFYHPGWISRCESFCPGSTTPEVSECNTHQTRYTSSFFILMVGKEFELHAMCVMQTVITIQKEDRMQSWDTGGKLLR